MNNLQIITSPNPLLHKKSAKVKKFDKALEDLAIEMVEMMKSHEGVGLSAVQVGKPICLTVIEYIPQNMDADAREELRAQKPIRLTFLVNPKITKLSKETYIGEEGCLSLPGINIPIKRSVEANVLAYDLAGNRIKIRAKDFFARVLQHEIDHLNGILITDKIKK
jgi:peptide deformylase